VVGVLVAIEASGWLPHTTELFSSEGFHIPYALTEAWPVPPPSVALVLCMALVASGVMVALGLRTRVAIASTLAIWTYFYGLDSINEKSAHTLVIVVLSILLFSPCSGRFSLDAWLRTRNSKPQPRSEGSILFQQLLRFQFAQAYFFSGVAKMTHPDWVNGNTFYRILNGRWATELGIFLSSLHPNLIARVGGLGTILFELFVGPALFIRRLRPWAIGIGVLFHVGTQATLWVGSLGFHFVAALLLCFPEPRTIAKKARFIQTSALFRGLVERMERWRQPFQRMS
jgi:uncharacterized membrane protein YphA (DoxX/SURF4 family)